MKKKPVFLNWRGQQGRETVDEYTQEENQTTKEFRAYVRKMQAEYALAGMSCYQSSRPCKGWND